MHPGSVEKFGKDFVKPGNMVSNGAYMLAEFVPNSHIKLVKNPNFYDAKNVQIDTVMYYPTSDFAAMVRRYEAGELDTTDDLPADQMKSLKERFGKQVVLGPYLGTWFLVVNTSKAPFSDVRVRQALSMVIDREFIAEQIWGQTMQPGYSFVPPGIGNYAKRADDGLQGHVADRPRGEGQGAPQGGRLRPRQAAQGGNPLQHDRQQPQHGRSRSPSSGRTSASRRPSSTPTARPTSRICATAATSTSPATAGSPTTRIRRTSCSCLKSDNKGFNYGKYNNPEFDKLLDQAAAEIDLQKRAELFRKAEADHHGATSRGSRSCTTARAT